MAMLLQYNTLHGEDAGETSGPSSAPVLDPPTIDLLPCHIPPPPCPSRAWAPTACGESLFGFGETKAGQEST